MYPSPLILKKHFFSKVEVNSHVDGDVEAINLLSCGFELGKDPDDQRSFQLILKLKIESPADKKATYTGEIHAVGIFQVAEHWPAEKVEDLVEHHGSSVLFAAIRELLLNITSRGPWPPVLLCTFSFLPPKNKIADSDAPSNLAAKV